MNVDEIVPHHRAERMIANALTVSNTLGAGFCVSFRACDAPTLSAFIVVHRRLNDLLPRRATVAGEPE